MMKVAEKYKIGIEIEGDAKSAERSLKVVKDGMSDVTKESKKADEATNQYEKSASSLNTRLKALSTTLKSIASRGTLGRINEGLRAAGQRLNTLSGEFRRLGGEFTTFITAPLTAIAFLSLRDKLGGELRELGALAKTAGENFAQFLLPPVRRAIGLFQELFKWFNDLDQGTKNIIYTVGAFAAAIGPVLLALSGITAIVGGVIQGLGVLTTVFSALITVLTGPAGVVIALTAVAGVLAGLVNTFRLLVRATGSWTEAFNIMSAAIRDYVAERLIASFSALIGIMADVAQFALGANSKVAYALRQMQMDILDVGESVVASQRETFARLESELESVGSNFADAMTFGFASKVGNLIKTVSGAWKSASAESKAAVNETITETIPALIDVNQMVSNTLAQSVNAVADGTRSLGDAFKDFARNALRSISQVITQMLILNALRSAFPGLSNLDLGLSGLATTREVANPALRNQSGSGFASGGLIQGPGTGTSDSIPIRASNGEYVFSAAAVKAAGANNIDNLHQSLLGRKKYANGGSITGNPVINIQNTGQPKTARAVNTGSGVTTIVLEDLNNNGPIAQNLRRRGLRNLGSL